MRRRRAAQYALSTSTNGGAEAAQASGTAACGLRPPARHQEALVGARSPESKSKWAVYVLYLRTQQAANAEKKEESP